MINRRDFLRLGALSGATLSAGLAPGLNAEAGKSLPDPLADFSFETVSNFWFRLMYGYSRNISEEMNWGTLPGPREYWQGAGGDPEMVTRALPALASWLSRPGRASSVTVDGATVPLQELFLKGLANGTDPEMKGYWKPDFNGTGSPTPQWTVESASVAGAAWFGRDMIAERFTEKQQNNVANWLGAHSYCMDCRESNWNLFYVLNNAVMKKLGWAYHPEVLHHTLQKVDAAYIGEGWYSDYIGHRKFDDYNHTVFATGLMEWVLIDGDSDPQLKKAVLERIPLLLKDTPYFFGADGSHPEYGRSVIYKFSRLSSLIMAHKLGVSPLPLGQLKRILRLHMRYYVNNGAVDWQSGIIQQRMAAGGSLKVRESYNSPGSVYWMMKPFAALWLLDDNDPLWSVDEEPLPIEQQNYFHPVKMPGWVLAGDRATGHVTLHNAGVDHGRHVWKEPSGTYPSKYRKFSYHGGLGYLAGNYDWLPCDNMVSIQAKGYKAEYPLIKNYRLPDGNPRVLALHQSHELIPESPGAAEMERISVSTLIFLKDDYQLRFHRVIPQNPALAFDLHEGGFALGVSQRARVKSQRGQAWRYAESANGAVMLGNLGGFDQIVQEERGYLGVTDAHTRSAEFILPYAKFRSARRGEQLLGLLVKGSARGFDPGFLDVAVLRVEMTRVGVEVSFADGEQVQARFI